jgi:hypothetical protein
MQADQATPQAEDEWGAFYALPPKWKKDDASNTIDLTKDEPPVKEAPTKYDLTKDDTPAKPSASRGTSKFTDENIGHRLASLLRYRLDDDNGITTDENGWVVAADIIENAEKVDLVGCTAEDLIRVAEHNEHSSRGKRFESDGAGRIKATYRHPPRRRDGRDNRWSNRRPRRYDGWDSNGWHDWSSNWRDSGDWQEKGEESEGAWMQWKNGSWTKPESSSSADDAIVKQSSWTEASEKPKQWDAADKEAEVVREGAGQPEVAAACVWEQWFTPDSMEMYFYNTQTEECFFPGDAADCEEKGWSRYVDTDVDKQGMIYWWHEATSRSFYEKDAIGDAEA